MARFIIDRGSDTPDAFKTPWTRAEAANDFIVRQRVPGLGSNTRYRYRLEFGIDETRTQVGPPRWFRTLPGPQSSSPLSFLMFNCMGWGQYMDGYGDRLGLAMAVELIQDVLHVMPYGVDAHT